MFKSISKIKIYSILFLISVLFVLFYAFFPLRKEIPDNNIGKKDAEKLAVNNPYPINGSINFVGQDFKLYYIEQITNGLAMYYSSDVLSFMTDSELIINQYGEKISAKNLADGVVAESKEDGQEVISPFISPDSKGRETYFITLISSDEYSDKTTGSVTLISVFEDRGKTYSLVYRKNFTEKNKAEVDKITYQWLLDNGPKYGEALTTIPLNDNIAFFDKNIEVANKISQSNRFKSLKWSTKEIKEDNIHAKVDIKYPRFTGGKEVAGLNKLISDTVLNALSEDRKDVQGWIKNGLFSTSSDDIENWSCRDAKKYDYECSVNLTTTFNVYPVVNDIVSLELVFTDYTGGGNGNHDNSYVINYDLKSNKIVNTNEFFCDPKKSNGIMDMVKSQLYADVAWSGDDDYFSSDKSIGDNFWNVLLDDMGMQVVFQPYEVASGAAGVVKAFVPYSEIANNICLK